MANHRTVYQWKTTDLPDGTHGYVWIREVGKDDLEDIEDGETVSKDAAEEEELHHLIGNRPPTPGLGGDPK